jgi:putative PIN family toxin of toxin-antitoxin system
MATHQIILDTNIIYSALRSRRGASYRLLSMLDDAKFEINLSVPLVIEYEDVLLRKIDTLNFSASQISSFLDYLCQAGNRHEVYFLWRPFLKDPKDDMILELAIRANCKYIITYNKADFQDVYKFGIQLMTAKEFLHLIQELP